MTDQELKDIVAAVVAELEKSGVDFDYKAEQAKDDDLVFVIRGTAPNYQGVTVTWKGLLDIITAQATQAKNDAETAKNTANTILEQVQSKGTEITNFVATSKAEIETQKNESVNAVKSVYQTDLDELKGDLDELYQGIEEGYINISFTLKDGYVNYSNGSISNYGNDGIYKRTDYILLDNILSNYTESIQHNFVSQDVAGVAFFDINKTFISGTTNNIIPINDIPTNAKYIMLSNYDLSKAHADKNIRYILTGESIKNVATKITSYYDSETIIPPLSDGYVNYTDYTISNYGSEGYYKRTEYIEIPTNCKYIEHNFSFRDSAGYVFFDASKVGVFGGNSSNRVSVPNNAKYVMFSSYSSSKNHENRTIQFVYYDYTIKGNGERIDRLEQKKVINNLVSFGDSHVARGLWQGKVIKEFKITTHTNLGIGSSTVAINDNGTQLPFVDDTRIQAIKDANPDIIIIIGGTNDVHLDTPLGTISELSKVIANKDKTNFYGAYSFLIETLLSWKPTLKIILCTTPQGTHDSSHTIKYSDVSNAIKEIGFYYSLPIADIFGNCGINKTNLSTYSADLIHYNEIGNERVSNLIISTINSSYF